MLYVRYKKKERVTYMFDIGGALLSAAAKVIENLAISLLEKKKRRFEIRKSIKKWRGLLKTKLIAFGYE